MRRILLALLMLTMPALASAETFPLKYGPKTDAGMFTAQRPVMTLRRKPKTAAAEPKYNARPRYACFLYGIDGKDRPFVMAADKSDPQAAFYDLLYVDRDRDGDLREEQPVKANDWALLKLPLPAGGRSVERAFSVRLVPFMAGGCRVIIKDAGTWAGEIAFAGRKMHITLMDVNVNGIYDDPLEVVAGGRMERTADVFATRPMRGNTPDYAALHFCPAVMAIGGKLYDARVAPDGSAIAFEPFTGPAAAIETPSDGLSAVLITTAGRCVNGTSNGRRIPIPAGPFRVFVYSSLATDAKGVEWSMTGGIGNRAILTAEEGKTVQLKAGPPVRVTVSSSQGAKAKAGSTVKFTSNITDISGGGVSFAAFGKVPGPLNETIILIKQGEKVIARGKCEPG